MKALDFVKTPKGQIALIKETNYEGTQASIMFISNKKNERNAWWSKEELIVINNLSYLLASNLCHPMGSGKKDIDLFLK